MGHRYRGYTTEEKRNGIGPGGDRGFNAVEYSDRFFESGATIAPLKWSETKQQKAAKKQAALLEYRPLLSPSCFFARCVVLGVDSSCFALLSIGAKPVRRRSHAPRLLLSHRACWGQSALPKRRRHALRQNRQRYRQCCTSTPSCLPSNCGTRELTCSWYVCAQNTKNVQTKVGGGGNASRCVSRVTAAIRPDQGAARRQCRRGSG